MEQSQITSGLGGALQGGATGFSVAGPVGGIIGGVVGGIAGFLSGGGEDEAKKAARAQANEIRRQARENKRIQTRAANLVVSTAKAATYASNILDTGSTRQYRNVLEGEYRRAIQYDYGVAMKNAATVQNYGTYAADSIKRQGIGQLIGGLTYAGTVAAQSGAFNRPAAKGNTSPTRADWISAGVPLLN